MILSCQLVLTVTFNWLVALLKMRVLWRYVSTTSGVLLVMMVGMEMMQKWFAENWAMLWKVS